MWSGDTYYAWTEKLYEEAWFSAGIDDTEAYVGNKSARIRGFWIRSEGGEDEQARAAFWREVPIVLAPETAYVLSYYYKTENWESETSDIVAGSWETARRPNVDIGYESNVLFGHDQPLPDTHGGWRKFVAVGWDQHSPSSDITFHAVRPVLSNWGVGEVWFDDVKVQMISFEPGVYISDLSTQFDIR